MNKFLNREYFIALYIVVPDGEEWPCWGSMTETLSNCRDLYNWWHEDLPTDNMKKDRKFSRMAKIRIEEIE